MSSEVLSVAKRKYYINPQTVSYKRSEESSEILYSHEWNIEYSKPCYSVIYAAIDYKHCHAIGAVSLKDYKALKDFQPNHWH